MKIPCHKSSAVRSTKADAAQATNAAFTLADLLALLGLFVLLALFLTPAQARTRVSEQGFQCLNNFRQLMTAMLKNKFSIDDGCFATVGPKQPPTYLMIDWPSIAHDGACTIAFGDGHSEIHRWRDTRTYLNTYASTMSQPGNQDIWWMSLKTTALINGPDFHVP